MMTDAGRRSDTSVHSYRTTWRHGTEYDPQYEVTTVAASNVACFNTGGCPGFETCSELAE
jgi:hypothetical protein